MRRSRGYRQLCSLWFEYDLCLNRKPPNDLESFFNDSDSNTIKVGSQKGLSYDSNMIKENLPMSSALCQSNGYRQLCSLWFEYDPCLNRKPPSDFKNCLTTLIRIRSTSVLKGVKLRFKYDQRKLPNELGTLPIKWVPTAMFSLVRIRPMFEQEAPK